MSYSTDKLGTKSWRAIAQVNQAKANVVKDEAQAKNNNVQAQRYRNLLSQGAVSKAQAVQAGQQGQYVFVVKPDKTVEVRPVTAIL